MTAFPPAAATDYDKRITRLVPGYQLALHMVAAELATRVPTSGHVLVPGCGTGNDLIALAEQCPTLRLHGVDPSLAMLEKAQAKLEERGLTSRVTLQHGETGSAPDVPFDAAVVSLVLHFLSDKAKQGLLADVATRISTGKPLILVDLEPVDTNATWRKNLLQWLDQQGHDPEQRAAILTRMSGWPCVSSKRQAQLCAAAGFDQPRELLRVLCYSVSSWCRN